MNRNILAAGLLLASAGKALAVFGVGDVVIVASNPAQELLWAANELPKWLEMIDKAKQQVNRAQETIDIIGHPEKFAGKLVDASRPMLEATKLGSAIKSSEEIMDFTEKSWGLFKDSGQQLAHTLKVDENYQVFGQTMKRDTKRYIKMAKEKALRGRLEDILKKKHDVDSQELDYQESALAAIRGASTQTEIALHQAGLAASKQRMDILASRVKQAEAELQTYMGDAELDLRKEGEMGQEQTEAALEEIRTRANAAVQHVTGNL